MYKISKAPEQLIPEINSTIMRLMMHPRLIPESKILICYIIRESQYNPDGVFQKKIFIKVTGLKRTGCDKALQQLWDKDILVKYTNDENESVYELDWDTLLDYLQDQTIIIKQRGFRRYNSDDESEKDSDDHSDADTQQHEKGNVKSDIHNVKSSTEMNE